MILYLYYDHDKLHVNNWYYDFINILQVRQLCPFIGSVENCTKCCVTIVPETFMPLIEYTVQLIWYTLLITQNSEVHSLLL